MSWQLAWLAGWASAVFLADRVVKMRLPGHRNYRALLARVPAPLGLGLLVSSLPLIAIAMPAGNLVTTAGLGLALGGAAGNLVDVIGRGCVLDPIRLPGVCALNVADLALSAGTLAVLGGVLL